MIKISQQDVWAKLLSHAKVLHAEGLKARFVQQPDRFQEFSTYDCGLLMDFSKHFCSPKTLQLWSTILQQVDFIEKRHALFNGDAVNPTENRPAWHTALRADAKIPQVQSVLDQMQVIVDRLWHQLWLGFSGKPITDVVNIGIGGSDFGPLMSCHALPQAGPVRCHFVSNLDQQPLESLLSCLNPETTVFVVISKSFTTLETLTNATAARQWLCAQGCAEKDLRQHFLAVTAKPERAIEFGVHANDILPMWDWVGGRFSMWSAVGLCIAIHTGMHGFNGLLAGAASMDQHFLEKPLAQNMPLIMGLLAVWYQNGFHASTQAIIPYHDQLAYLPNYLQQLHMESLGKRVNFAGDIVDYQTGQVIWGSTGTNSQHAYHQLLMQGTQMIPVDFITLKEPQQSTLFANCLAQAEVLMSGYASDDPHQVIPGNQPSTMLVLDALTPQTLGALIALYEHKVFVQSVVWQINAFDQYGVERGKVMANQISASLQHPDCLKQFDASTQGLIAHYMEQEKVHV